MTGHQCFAAVGVGKCGPATREMCASWCGDAGAEGDVKKKQCAICGFDLSNDLFADVTGEKCCAICKVKFIGGLPTSDERIALARSRLGLTEGEYLQQDNGAEAARILGHRR